MLDFPLWKRVWLWAVTLFFALAAVPSLVSLTGANWPAALPNPMVNLGLDLAGGSHILLEPPTQTDAARSVREPLTTGAGLTGQRDWTIEGVDGSRFVIAQTNAGL